MTEFIGWTEVLHRVTAREDLTADEAEAAMAQVLAGEAEPVQLAAFIAALRTKGESVDEVAGMVDAMLAAAEPLDIPDVAIDIVGTGGSTRRRGNAVNVSTMASFVAAAGGATVCKHGNRKASSSSGSSDLLEALGLTVELSPAGVAICVNELGSGSHTPGCSIRPCVMRDRCVLPWGFLRSSTFSVRSLIPVASPVR